MTSYFDATSTADQQLLLKAFRAHDDLASIAVQAEADVIQHFTRRLPPAIGFQSQFYLGIGYHKGNGIWVSLEGFNPDASLVAADHADLKSTLKATIADVINWRLAKTGISPVLKGSGTAVGQYKNHRDDVNEPFPPGDWDWRMKPYNLKLPLYTI